MYEQECGRTLVRMVVGTMAATVQASRLAPPNHRRRVRHKVHAPAYATFTGASSSEMLDLYEILDISEIGVAVQCSSSLSLQPCQQVELCLDLAEAGGTIWVTGQVVWSDPSGRTGFHLPALNDSAVRRLREWLFLNAIAAAANAAAFGVVPSLPAPVRPNYTDLLAAASAVQSEAELLGGDLVAVLALIASRSQSMLRASGAAIALVSEDDDIMICRASVGQSAPPEGAALRVGSGFSGECVRTGKILRCDDAETDERVDPQSCRALGIRSILAVPVNSGEKPIGLLEVFSPQSRSFGENDGVLLQRFAETIVAAVRCAILANSSQPPAESSPFSSQGSVLFASEIAPEKNKDKNEKNKGKDLSHDVASANPDNVGGVRLPRIHLWLLIAALATISLVLGVVSAPLIQPWIQRKFQGRQRIGSVLASSRAPDSSDVVKPSPTLLSVDSANLAQLRQLADKGNPAAENALGLLYAQGDASRAIQPDQAEAARWFTKAAEQNYVPAQSKLGAFYWRGSGVPASLNQAYFWTVLARAGGDQTSKTLAPVLAAHMTRAQAAAIEQQAEMWYRQHESPLQAQAER